MWAPKLSLLLFILRQWLDRGIGSFRSSSLFSEKRRGNSWVISLSRFFLFRFHWAVPRLVFIIVTLLYYYCGAKTYSRLAFMLFLRSQRLGRGSRKFQISLWWFLWAVQRSVFLLIYTILSFMVRLCFWNGVLELITVLFICLLFNWEND